MNPGRRFAALLVLLLATAALAQPAPRRFGIPAHGNLVLYLPADWRVTDESTDSPPSVTVVGRPASGDAFLLQLTSVRIDSQRRLEVTPEHLRQRLHESAKRMLPTAVEKDATMIPLRGRQARGYYFSLTDRESKNAADDYKHVTQGSLVVGEELVIVFTFLHRDPALPEKDRLLRAFAEAEHARKEPAAARKPRADAVRIVDAGEAWELTVPVSKLAMTVPKNGMARASNPFGGGADHPRYFYFSAGGLNVSGWFEPAQRYGGLQSFWEKETAGWTRRGLPPAHDVVFTSLGNWEIVAYDMEVPRGSNSHVRAHWIQAGTWIDVHISLTSGAPSADARARVMSILRGIQVREKEK